MRPYVLPDLPYGHGALEPHVWGRTTEAHHRIIHQRYVDLANYEFSRLAVAREEENFVELGAIERSLAFNLSGHVLHSIFWHNLAPEGGDRPQGPLADAIEHDFASFESFKQLMNESAMSLRGSGWAALAWDPLGRRLQTVQIQDHGLGMIEAPALLMLIDVWEHAYVAQYRADKQRYFEGLWKLWNWEDIGARFERAVDLDVGLDRPIPRRPLPLPVEAPQEPAAQAPDQPQENLPH